MTLFNNNYEGEISAPTTEQYLLSSSKCDLAKYDCFLVIVGFFSARLHLSPFSVPGFDDGLFTRTTLAHDTYVTQYVSTRGSEARRVMRPTLKR